MQLVISAQSAPLMVRGQISAHSTSVRAPLMLNNINIVVFSVCKCSFGCMLSTDYCVLHLTFCTHVLISVHLN